MKTINKIEKVSKQYSRNLAQTLTLHDTIHESIYKNTQFIYKGLHKAIDFTEKSYTVAQALIKNLAGKRVVKLQARHKEFLENELKVRTAAKINFEYLATKMNTEMEIIEDKVKNA
jgi:hypothetical protein